MVDFVRETGAGERGDGEPLDEVASGDGDRFRRVGGFLGGLSVEERCRRSGADVDAAAARVG